MTPVALLSPWRSPHAGPAWALRASCRSPVDTGVWSPLAAWPPLSLIRAPPPLPRKRREGSSGGWARQAVEASRPLPV